MSTVDVPAHSRSVSCPSLHGLQSVHTALEPDCNALIKMYCPVAHTEHVFESRWTTGLLAGHTATHEPSSLKCLQASHSSASGPVHPPSHSLWHGSHSPTSCRVSPEHFTVWKWSDGQAAQGEHSVSAAPVPSHAVEMKDPSPQDRVQFAHVTVSVRELPSHASLRYWSGSHMSSHGWHVVSSARLVPVHVPSTYCPSGHTSSHFPHVASTSAPQLDATK